MNTFRQTAQFVNWLEALDEKNQVRILARLRSAMIGNFGDCKPVGEGVSEMRVHHGPGYRVYYAREGERVYLLILGGDKKSQKRDIQKAKELWRALRESTNENGD